ncbi:MAG: hypothetical protein ACSHWW_14075 [Nonlabens sp.]|uniref:hypothetical protein n=1 Tax=Nonlabens sp. TaxID=1888209 RepID=UPI003EF86F85
MGIKPLLTAPIVNTNLAPYLMKQMNLIEDSKRKEVLLQFGIPRVFLDAIDNIKTIDSKLTSCINYPKGAYYYLPKIANYSIYKGYNVVPICDSGQGDSFYLLLYNNTEQKIIYNEIEQDEIYANFGLNINAVITTILIEFYALMDDEEVEDRNKVLKKIADLGYELCVERKYSIKTMERIFQAEDNDEDRYNNSRKWFDKNILPLLK